VSFAKTPQRQNIIQVTSYTTSSYVIHFKCAPNFGEPHLPGTENADQPAEEMSERYDYGKNFSGKVQIKPLFAKSFILQVYDVLAMHTSSAMLS
jgi:hypothetical protein